MAKSKGISSILLFAVIGCMRWIQDQEHRVITAFELTTKSSAWKISSTLAFLLVSEKGPLNNAHVLAISSHPASVCWINRKIMRKTQSTSEKIPWMKKNEKFQWENSYENIPGRENWIDWCGINSNSIPGREIINSYSSLGKEHLTEWWGIKKEELFM